MKRAIVLAVLCTAAMLACEAGGVTDAGLPTEAHEGAGTGATEDMLPELFEDRTLFPTEFADPQQDCVECHEQHVQEWEISNHAYAQKDPVYLAMVKAGQAATGGKLGQFCVQCHTPTGLANDLTPVVELDDGTFMQDFSQLDEIGQQGVSCDVCHTMSEVVEPVNARMAMTPDGNKRGGIVDPIDTDAHGSVYSELHKSPEMCGSCHAVVNPKGALIEETFGEYARSSAAERGETCQTCHMPAYTGRATPDAPERELHRHTFVGVDVSLLPPDEFPGYDTMRELTTELLRSSAEFSARYAEDSGRVELAIENKAGHALPSGATAERQMWVEILVRDADDNVVFESGTLDAGDDVRDGIHGEQPGTDPQLIYFGQQMIDIEGFADMNDAEKATARERASENCISIALGAVKPDSGLMPVTFPWQASWQCNYLIEPDETAQAGYDLPELPAGDYVADIRLLFRTFPPYFLRELEAVADLDPEVKTRLPTVEMATERLSFSVR